MRAYAMLTISVWLLFSVGCTQKPDPFTPDVVRSYASLVQLQEAEQLSGYIAGKAVVVNIGETISLSRMSMREERHHIPANTISTAHQKIAGEICAATPEEVRSVVLLNWSKEALGETMAGTKYRLLCAVIVVDKARNRIVARKPFIGDGPRFATLYGPSPEDQIVQFINALPRQAPQPSAPLLAEGKESGAGQRSYTSPDKGVSFRHPESWVAMTPEEVIAKKGPIVTKDVFVSLADRSDHNRNLNIQFFRAQQDALSRAELATLER